MFRVKLLALLVFAGFAAVLLLTENAANPHARAYSSGPPAGFTHAPGELDCSDCHTAPAQSTGALTLGVPEKYTPGRTYDITVTHSSGDPTRVRWGFQMTALDAADQKAGAFEPADDLTRVIEGEGPFPAREYVEHTAKGTFAGQQNGAAWAFRWTAPAEDVGPVTFYLAGNQANGDFNSSGDNIYFTFRSAAFEPPAPDFRLSVTPSTRNVVRGGAAAYDVTVTPLNGFTGSVSLSAAGLPAGASAAFQPASLNVTGSSPQTSVLTVNTSTSTPTGGFALSLEASAGALTRSAQATLNVFAADDADVAVTQSVSPNPAQTGADIRYTVTVSNNGPATATALHLVVLLPTSISGVTEGAGGEYCHTVPAGSLVGYDCQPPAIPAGQSRTFDFTVRTQTPGVINSTTTVRALQHDPLPSNNEVTQSVSVAPQSSEPSMTVPGLGVRTVVSGLRQPTTLAFLGADDFFVLEKASGRVLRVKGGSVKGIALDLAVNSASERGLLGIALHPGFASNGFAYLYWTESATGADTTAVEEVPLLGNRVDRFHWDGARLTFDRTLVRLRAQQTDAGQPARGNHNGGVLRFGPDGKLYVLAGDVGRRGLMQNLPCGPTTVCPGTVVADDQHGGPEPDDAHLSGVVLRLNDDGTTPSDNPYAQIPTVRAGEADVNIRKVFAYGVRNSFGMDFDPFGGALWTQENGDDSFDEINRVEAGFNGGWAQLMGPSARVAEFKAIETSRGNSLQQNRWPPSSIADTPAEALARLYVLPGSRYTEPEFSWKYAVAPSPVGFAGGAGLGAQFAGDLFVGASRTTLLGGYLMRFELSADRKHLSTPDARLADGVADNADKFDLSESESLVVGRDFGVTTDIRSEPGGGSLYVVSLSNGAVYQVFARRTLFAATLTGGEETPPNNSQGRGRATVLLDADERTAHVSLDFDGLSSPQTAAHIHGPASQGQSAPPLFELPEGGFEGFKITLNPQQVSDLRNGFFYVNVHSTTFPGGEIRGQLLPAAESSAVGFAARSARVSEGDPSRRKTFEVVRYGDLSSAVGVRYTTRDGTASERSDYTTSGGTLFFAPGEARKSIDVLVNDDGLPEGEEDFHLRLFGPTGPVSLLDPEMTVAVVDDDQGRPAVNLIDDTQFFVRQHYHDFLGREPDPEGLAFWTDEIESCGADARCREVKRVNVSAAFFLSIEFQETGYLVYRMYRASGETNNYRDFIADTQRVGRGVVVGQGDWRARLDANRQNFADELVGRASFRSRFDALSNREFVERLYANSLVVPPAAERDSLVAALDDGTKTRARVQLDVVENAELKRLWFNRAFVLMQYYGYLRRNPDDPPDANLDGYNFWLEKLERFGGNYVEAEMVKAFISSAEYRRRFGP
jgi:uncharacterized repeat protein (TIGR01451 family)